jgi:hypothetical protein
MATKKTIIARRAVKCITLPELLNIVEKAYDPEGFLVPSFVEVIDENGKLVKPGEMGDTQADFLIRELGQVFKPHAGASTNLDIAAETVNSAIRQLMAVEAALLRANYGEGGYAAR